MLLEDPSPHSQLPHLAALTDRGAACTSLPFLLESLPSARQPREANDRGGEAKPGRTHESRRRKTEKGPEAPPAGRPAGRPSAGTAQGDGCREQPGSACTREPQSPLQVGKRAAGIQTRTGSRDEAHGLGRARGAGPRRSAQPPLPQRKRSAQGGIAPFAGGQQRSVAFFLTAAFRRRRVTPLADHPTPGKAHGPAGSGGSRHGAGTAASPPAAARGQPPPRAAPLRPPRPAAAPQPPAASRRASRAARRALSEGPARSRRRERRRAARPALTARLHCGGPSARSDRRTRTGSARGGENPLGAAQGRSARLRLKLRLKLTPPQPGSGSTGAAAAPPLGFAPLRPSATSSDPLSDAYRPRALLFKHSGPRDWPGG